jgi:hypothetical protein
MPLDRTKPQPLGLTLRRKRERLRLSLDDVAQLFRERGRKVDKSTISRIETGALSMPRWFGGLYVELLQSVVIDDGLEMGLRLVAAEGDEDAGD